jgi:transposase-like protein
MKKKELKVKSTPQVKAYSEAFKQTVVQEFEKGILNKDQIQIKYGIGGNSRVLEWCRKYGKLHYPKKGFLGRPMKDPQKQRIRELEKQLEEAKLKVLAYEKLISNAEQAEGISILKKDVAKQLTSLPKPTPEK